MGKGYRANVGFIEDNLADGEAETAFTDLPAVRTCWCECHGGVGTAFRCGHCFAYYDNDWSEVIRGREPISRGRVEFRVRG